MIGLPTAIRSPLLTVAALAAVVLVPTASAGHVVNAKLSLIPLPKSSLGPAARGMTLAQDSGVRPNSAVSPGFELIGRISGYLLDYGDAFRGGAGVTAIESAVDKYRSPRGAKRAVAFARTQDAVGVAALNDAGLTFTGKSLPRPRLGGRSFAFVWTSGTAGIDPVSIVDVQWSSGRFTLEVQVAAGTSTEAEPLAEKLAHRLDKRLRLGLAGRLHGKPVKLPPRPKAGPPPGGPSLAALALQSPDFGGTATVQYQTYAVAPPAISEYDLDIQPAGAFDDLTQSIDWWPNVNEAAFYSRIEVVLTAELLEALVGTDPQVTPIDVSSIGDAQQAAILHFSTSSREAYFAIVSLSSGQATNLLLAFSPSSIQPSNVQNLAQLAANRLDAGLAG
jgi:hypothetical protein